MISLHARVQNASQKIVFFLERGPGGDSLPAAWALKINVFQKTISRKEVSVGRVAGTAQVPWRRAVQRPSGGGDGDGDDFLRELGSPNPVASFT